MARRVDRRILLAAGAVVAGVAYGLWPREDRKVLSMLEGLCEQLNRARDPASLTAFDDALTRAAAPNFGLRVTELGDETRDLAQTRELARQLLTSAPRTFSLVDAEAHVENTLARVQANLLVSERGSNEQHRDLRPTQIQLHRLEGVWVIESIVILPSAPERPEARP